MVNNFIQQVTANQNPQRRNINSKEISPEELQQPPNFVFQKEQELTKNNEVYQDNFYENIEKKFNVDVAILYVIAETEKYRIHCYNSKETPLYTELIDLPLSLSFSQYIQGNTPAEKENKMREIPGIMKRFSEEKTAGNKIRNWLSNLSEIQYIVIHDETDFEIPWEMLKLKGNNFLGASIVTLRWQNIWHPDLDTHIPLEFEQTECKGNLIAYINTNELDSVQKEKIILEQFYGEKIENIYTFLDHLENVQDQIGLMFIASHGFFGKDFSNIGFGENKDNNQNISLNYLEGRDFEFFKASPSVVFTNACHSGRLMRDQSNITPYKYRTGFATFFLKRGAKGFIGTLSKVLDKQAAEVTEMFFEEYQQNPQLAVAEILRNVRNKAVHKLKINENDNYEIRKKKELLLVSTFMYVYYGNPMTTLRLTTLGE